MTRWATLSDRGPRWRRRWSLAGIALLTACRGNAAPAPPAPPVAVVDARAQVADVPAARAPVTGADDGDSAGSTATEVARGRSGAVASAERQATEIGITVLRAGGNAVDAAIAVGFALGVTHPSAGNIGGGGFMVVRRADGTSTSFDFREVAPGGASANMYVGADGKVSIDSQRGPRAAGIPGVVAGFGLAHRRLGSRPWADLVTPAVGLARQGHVLDRFHADDLAWAAGAARAYLDELPTSRGPRALAEALRETIGLWRGPNEAGWRAGDTWTQPALADTLAAIAKGGADAFYQGPLAERLATGVARIGGLWTVADLAAYRALERTPITFDHAWTEVTTMPPPSAGGVTLRQLLAASAQLGLARRPWDDVDRLHTYVEVLRRLFADRSVTIADPAFVAVPLPDLLDPARVARRVADIDPARATPSRSVGGAPAPGEHEETTHYSVVDAGGMAVAVTFTLNGGFGAKVIAPGTGVILNNEMDDFTAKVGAPNMFGLVQGPQNAIAPGKRMVSSMTPTIVAAAGHVRLVCGSPGGPTIITTVGQILMQVLDHGRSLEAAIAAPRVHHQWQPDAVWHEAGLAPALQAGLRARGHMLTDRGRMGHANCIERTPDGELRAVADTGRDGGAAAAY